MTEYSTGTIKMFNGKTGYGFITPDTESPDVMLHNSIAKYCDVSPQQGMRVRYRAVLSPRGLRAVYVEEVER